MKHTENLAFNISTKYFWKIDQKLPAVISTFQLSGYIMYHHI